MKCGISTACFYPEPLENTIAPIAALGLDTAEIFINTESEFSPNFAAALREQLDASGIDAISVHPYTSPMEGQMLLSDYARRTEDGIAQYRRYFAAARTLGARYLTFHGERSVIGDRDAADTARKLRVYARLCAVAAEYDIILAQENVAWCKSEDPAYLQRLYDNVPQLGFTLDIKQAHRSGHHWSEYLDVMCDRLVNVHINDFDETHSCRLPGEGVMDFEALHSHLRGVGYAGHVLIEVYRADYRDLAQISRAVTFLQSIIAADK